MRNTPIKMISTIAMDLSNLRVVILSGGGGGGGNEFGICAVEGCGERRMKRRRRR